MDININVEYSKDGKTVSMSLADWQVILLLLQKHHNVNDNSNRPTKRPPDASPDTCEHGFMRGNCYVEVCEFSKYGECW